MYAFRQFRGKSNPAKNGANQAVAEQQAQPALDEGRGLSLSNTTNTFHAIQALQRAVGNQATRALLYPPVRRVRHGVTIQRALSMTLLNRDENRNPAGNTPKEQMQARQAWIKQHIRNEVKRIMNDDSFDSKKLEQLKSENHEAFSLIKYEIPYIDIDFKKVLTNQDILKINALLNRLEQAVDSSRKPPKEIANTYVGNEFTFVDDDLEGIEAKDKDDLHEQMIEPYNTIASNWEKAMNAKGIEPTKKYKLDKLIKLQYVFTQDKFGVDWEYQVTPDQKCVEVITGKAKGADIFGGHVGNLMDEYLFGIAQAIGLRAHETIGGGHINLDEQTTFGSTDTKENSQKAAKMLAYFMQEFYADHTHWEKEDTDTHNAPFPKDIGKQEAFEQVIQKFNQQDWTIDTLADHLISKVFNTSLVSNNPSEAPHYQALNVEHLKSSKTDDTRRLEVRRVPAQSSRKKLIEQLTRIAGLLKAAKEKSEE